MSEASSALSWLRWSALMDLPPSLPVFQDVVDLLGTGLAVADFGLGAFRAGLRIDDQAIGFGQRLLQLALLGVALAEHLLKLRHAQRGIPLGDGLGLAFLEPGELFLAVAGFFRGPGQLLLQRGKLLLAVFLAGQLAQGLFEHLLQGLLVGLRQLALSDLVEAVLDAGGGRGLCGSGRKGKGQAQPEQGCAKVHAQGHRQTTCGSGRNEV